MLYFGFLAVDDVDDRGGCNAGDVCDGGEGADDDLVAVLMPMVVAMMAIMLLLALAVADVGVLTLEFHTYTCLTILLSNLLLVVVAVVVIVILLYHLLLVSLVASFC